MRPIAGIPNCVRQVGLHPFHIVGDKYVRAVTEGASAFAFGLPALGDAYDWRDLLSRLDGLLITGSPSDVHPDRYGGPPSAEGSAHDLQRDATTLPLIREAVSLGMPVLAICRGIQELNVAFGGTLHQNLTAVDGRFTHNPDQNLDVEGQYAPAHPVDLTADGLLARMFGKTEIMVNSIHRQGIDRMADGLVAEAVAKDGQIEAVRVANAAGFAIGVQWHPEWRFWENPESTKLFNAFGNAMKAYASGTKSQAAE